MQASWGYVVTTLAATLSPWLREELDTLGMTQHPALHLMQ
jgi:hypothetical protein